MRLVDDWKVVLTRAWSIRFMLLAAVFTGLEAFLPLIQGYVDVPPMVFASISGLCVGLGFVSRLVAQESVSGKGGREDG